MSHEKNCPKLRVNHILNIYDYEIVTGASVFNTLNLL